uniref:Hypoxia up-regulated protein 1 n=1 Tax=Panagrolaimus superbus TaxID=310955 RepID=A0A914Z917_9BILA
MILKDSFIVYHVSEFGRYPILNSFDNEETPAYIGLYSLPPAIGEAAQNQLENYPNSTVYDFIPMFGKEFSQIEINPKWKFTVIQSKDDSFAEIQMETLRGKRRSSISTLMAIMFKHIQQIAASYADFPITEVKVTFAHELNFCNIQLLKAALKNANLDLIENN